MNKQREPKRVWRIRVSPEGLFYMVDNEGETRWTSANGQSRHKMFEYAVEKGADEVVHDYDCVKYGT